MTDTQRHAPALRPENQPGPARPDPRRWKALILLCVANFMIILDAQIVILALPSIEKDLPMSVSAGQWVLSAYLLAFGGLLLLGGRLADLRGHRRMFLIGAALFMVSSLLCGLAWTGGALIGARVLQGVSAAMMAPAALAILMTMFPRGAERTKALACWSGVGGLGATAALLIGGALTGTLGWEWIFFLNLPVAAGMLIFGPTLLAESRDTHPARAYDASGALTVTVALISLIAAIVEAPTQGWTSGLVLGLLLAAVVLVAVFIVIESRSSAPLVPLRIFRSRLFVGGNLTIALLTMIAWGAGFTVSTYAQDVLGYSPLRFGLATTAMTAMTIVGAFAAQRGVSKLGFRAVAMASMAFMGSGAFLLAQVPVHGSYLASVFPGLLLLGLGIGSGPVAAISAALSSAKEEEAGVASGINTAFFQIGGALGTAVVSGLLISQAGGSPTPTSELGGLQAGFTACVVFAAIGLCVALTLLRRRTAARRRPQS
jgi:EmrB/QacA subfamily drug resistance transporter